jgi:hypothetical protein
MDTTKGKKMKVRCFWCNKEFEKSLKEYNRSEKIGRRHFCSRSCSGRQKNKEYPSDATHLLGIPYSRKFDEYSSFRWFVKSCRYRQDKKGKTDITVEYLKELWGKQQGKCPFTGWEMKLPVSTSGFKSCQIPSRASLDRIDITKGYVIGNVRFICVMANYARNSFTDEQLIEFGKAVAGKHCGSSPPASTNNRWIERIHRR